MKTLQEAVDELNGLTNPEETLRRYSNQTLSKSVTPEQRMSSCPVAQYLSERVGNTVRVGALGFVVTLTYPTPFIAREVFAGLSIEIYDIVKKLDHEFIESLKS